MTRPLDQPWRRTKTSDLKPGDLFIPNTDRSHIAIVLAVTRYDRHRLCLVEMLVVYVKGPGSPMSKGGWRYHHDHYHDHDTHDRWAP